MSSHPAKIYIKNFKKTGSIAQVVHKTMSSNLSTKGERERERERVKEIERGRLCRSCPRKI
jgi:hypothetical protein